MIKERLARFIGDSFAKKQYKSLLNQIYLGNPKTILDIGGSSGILATQILKKEILI